MANQKYKIELTALDKTKKAFSAVKTNLSKAVALFVASGSAWDLSRFLNTGKRRN